MNRIILLLLSVVCTLSASAQLSGDGYYRIQNKETQRYITVRDGYGYINMSTTDADMSALRTVFAFERVVSDPSSIIYIKKIDGGYDFQSQGTGTYSIIKHPIKIDDWEDGTYGTSATAKGMTKVLSDSQISWMWDEDDERRIYGKLTTTTTSEDAISWYILPIKATGDSYFGITPDVTVGSKYYKSFYAAFPFTFASEGMKAFYVSEVNESKSYVLIKEVTGGVPASTPVIIECSSTTAAGNKLNVGASVSGSASGNKMTGVYFCRPKDEDTSDKHVAVVEYDPSTMRVLGTTSDGRLAFMKNANLLYIPANSVYITVSTSAPDVLYATETVPEDIPGDLNGDSVVDGQDLVIETNYILSNTYYAKADLNNDGVVDGADYVILVNMILGK